MRNARILARMVASTLAAAVLVAGMATAASAQPADTGWKIDNSVKHTTAFKRHRLVENPTRARDEDASVSPPTVVPAIPQAVSIEAGGV